MNENDILISLDRPLILTGLKIAKVTSHDIPSLLLQRVARINSQTLQINNSYVYLWFNSSLFIDEINPGRSNGVPHISSKEIENLLFPLPPLREQHEIATKVQKLQQKLSQLQKQGQQTRDHAQQLLQSVLKDVFGITNDFQVNFKLERNQVAIEQPYLGEEKFSNFNNMKIIEILQEAKEHLQANTVWKQSDYKNDIEEFYAQLKKLIDEEKSVVEEKVGKYSYLKLASNED